MVFSDTCRANFLRVAVGLAILVGVALRFYEIEYSLDVDEIYSTRVASLSSLSHVIEAALADRPHPPLYYVLLHFWVNVVGTSEFGVRAFSVLVSTLFLIVLSKVALKLTSGFTAWFIVMFCAVNGFFIFYGQEARPYSLVALFSTLSILCLLKIDEHPDKTRYTISYLLCCSALLYTHYMGLLFVAPQLAIGYLGKSPRRRSVVLYGIGGLVLVVPWLLIIGKGLYPSTIHLYLAWRAKPRWSTFWYWPMDIFGWLPVAGSTRILYVAIIVSVIGLRYGANATYQRVLILFEVLFPPLAALLISLCGPVSIFVTKQLIGAATMLVCLIGLGLGGLRRSFGIILGLFFLAWSLMSLPTFFRHNTLPGRELAASLHDSCSTCKVMVPDSMTQLGLAYYSNQTIESVDNNNLASQTLPIFKYWYIPPPVGEHPTDRLLLLCRPNQCNTMQNRFPDAHVDAERKVKWGSEKDNPNNVYNIQLLRTVSRRS